MSIYTYPARSASRVNSPFDHDRRHRADFARQATIAAFGWRHARALDQADFTDRAPAACRTLRQRALWK